MKKALASIVVSKAKDIQDYGSIILNKDCRIVEFKEKYRRIMDQFVNAGVYCFNQEIFSRMPVQNKFSLEQDFFPELVMKDFYGFVVTEKFLDIGTPERLNKAKKILEK